MATNKQTANNFQTVIVSSLFDSYINIYRFKKENAKSPAEKQKAKIMLNKLYGQHFRNEQQHSF